MPDNQITKTFSIVGSSFRFGAWSLIERLRPGETVALKREPTNSHDRNAVMVGVSKRHVGYVPRGLAAEIAPIMDAGITVICRKAPNTLKGVCELAYVPPAPPPVPTRRLDLDLEPPHDPVPN